MYAGKGKPQERAPGRLTRLARLSRLTADGEELIVLSYPRETRAPVAGLTPAEQGVLDLLRAGLSNTQVAAARGTSVRTVANQVASVFRKLGVQSRAELFVKLGSGAVPFSAVGAAAAPARAGRGRRAR
jgi:DNA-binding NarL/FixJ family response regulator